MTTPKLNVSVWVRLGICVAVGIIVAGRIPAPPQAQSEQPKAPNIESITAEELKAKVVKKEPVTIIDVRASDAYVSSENKIDGAIFVRFRRLRSRLSVPPLKDIPREQEVVTYCACPNRKPVPRRADSHGGRVPAGAGPERWMAGLAQGQWPDRIKAKRTHRNGLPASARFEIGRKA